MTARSHGRSGARRELLLDGVAVALGALLVLVTTTGLNRLPYPGVQRYARTATVTLNAPAADLVPDLAPDADPETSVVTE